MKANTMFGFLLVVGLWYAIGYLQGFDAGSNVNPIIDATVVDGTD